ncbi:hypothetical protein [Nonomuraea sp. KM88]|uniref:hypothetical protein n=1 Tax=Nonomuraea sp. KM88 TaxID=3457427 RepID=UPI003FCCD084
MQRLRAVLVIADAEPRDRRLRLVQQAELLPQSEPAEQVLDPLLQRQAGVLERMAGRLAGRNGEHRGRHGEGGH